MIKSAPFLAALLFITACTGGTPTDYLKMRGITPPTPSHFDHCYDYGCKTHVSVSLPDATQKKLKAVFSPPSSSAKEEQKRIMRAIQIFETDIGDLTGTKNDFHGTFRLYQNNNPKNNSFQQDCIDESTNTTTYLILLKNMEYLKFYTPAFPANRQPFFGGGKWWHQTATIQDDQTKQRYAVDSWFEDNGQPPYIVPLEEWKQGWKPKRN